MSEPKDHDPAVAPPQGAADRIAVSPWAAPDRPAAAPVRAAIFPGTEPPVPADRRGPHSAAFGPPRHYRQHPGDLPGPGTAHRPSGLFPGPTRPTYREPNPAGGAPIAVGVLAGTVWMALLAVLATSARAYVWWTVAAGLLGWGAATALARFGDRGVAVGVALACALGVAIAFVVVIVTWVGGHWLLW